MGITNQFPAVSSVLKVLCNIFYMTCIIIVLCNSSLLADNDQATLLTTELVALGFSSPVFLTAPQNDSRLFVLEQSSGKIKIIKNGIVTAIPFLEIPNKISSGGERGLLGLAFRHDYNITGQFYLNYTRASDGATVISRFTVSGDPDIADSTSEQIVLVINQPYSNHNGGMIAFGVNDDYLYIGMGDGGSGGDPQNNAQDSTSLLGKILRIDVDGGPPYSIPATNPFVDHPTAAEEIWAMGVRNPWRFSFDRLTGDIYFGDVGQSAREEISYQPFSSGGGENYGWRCYEGNNVYNSSGCGPATDYVFPIYEYGQSSGRCSITGGYVYAGCAIPDLLGTYFFGDYCTGEIWSFEYDGVTVSNFLDRTSELDPPGAATIGRISSFGEDGKGEIYILDYGGGQIYKIVPKDVPSACSASCGDTNGDGSVNLGDAGFLINYIFFNGPAPDPIEVGDANGDGVANLGDSGYIINFIFYGGPAPVCT